MVVCGAEKMVLVTLFAITAICAPKTTISADVQKREKYTPKNYGTLSHGQGTTVLSWVLQ